MSFPLITDAFEYITSMDSDGVFRVFWYFIIFDFPRYILTDVVMVGLDLFKRRRPPQENAFVRRLSENPPLVSLIIPALNEQDTIAWTIRSLQEQTYDNLQIIIVDDGSTDASPEICRDLVRKNKNLNYYRFSERAGKSAVLNYGLSVSKGEFIIFVDSDTTFDRDAVFTLMKAFSDPEVGGVSGNLRVRNGNFNVLTRLQQIEYLFTISIGRRIRADFDVLPIISGAFGGFRREIVSLEKLGGHEPGPGNDSDLAIRVRKKGYKIVFVPEANCLTNVPVKLLKLIKQRARWDRNIIKNRVRKHRNVFNASSSNFRMKDLVTFIDSIFFHVVLSFITVFYIVDMSINYPRLVPILLLLNFFLYFCAEIVELLISAIITGSTRDLSLALYIPLFNPYKIFMKMVRVFAYCQELFFRYSYQDPFAPPKVRREMIRW